MATTQNLSAGDIIPQMGFAPTQSQEGGWRATREYYMLASTWETTATQNRFATGTPVTTADSTIDAIYSFLAVESKTANYEDSGTVKLSVNYTGANFSQFGGDDGDLLTQDAIPRYRLDGRLRELSVSEHPKFRALDELEQATLRELITGRYRWLPTTISSLGITQGVYIEDADGKQTRLPADMQLSAADAITFAGKISTGDVTYQAPSLVWTETTQGETGMTPQQLGKLGEISIPRGDAPTISGYDWMLTSASQDQQGQLFQTTIEWTLSTSDGWDTFLYTST
jgi:hypothetical protein